MSYGLSINLYLLKSRIKKKTENNLSLELPLIPLERQTNKKNEKQNSNLPFLGNESTKKF